MMNKHCAFVCGTLSGFAVGIWFTLRLNVATRPGPPIILFFAGLLVFLFSVCLHQDWQGRRAASKSSEVPTPQEPKS